MKVSKQFNPLLACGKGLLAYPQSVCLSVHPFVILLEVFQTFLHTG
jgi:hypothetical protein